MNQIQLTLILVMLAFGSGLFIGLLTASLARTAKRGDDRPRFKTKDTEPRL